MTVQPNSYRGFRVTRGDATGAQLAILVPDTYRTLHFASAADEATDWNVANPTHPTFYVHSETTPATDYLSLTHDGTTGTLASVGGTLTLNGVTTLNLQVGEATEVDLTATVLNVLDGNILWVGVEATPGTTAGANWIGLEDSTTDPAGTLTNSLALYTPDAGDSLDFLHADGTTDSLGT